MLKFVWVCNLASIDRVSSIVRYTTLPGFLFLFRHLGIYHGDLIVNHYLADPLSKAIFPISKAGYPFIVALAFATTIFALTGLSLIALLLLFSTLFTCFFFRDPDRVIPVDPSAIVSPADGTVLGVHLVEDCDYLHEGCRKISIFMSIFDVHVNRVPIGGVVKQVKYYPGKYFSANMDKASKNNERNAILLETDGGISICFVQIAGLVARRIVCEIKVDDLLKKGQRFGLICFGSRLDMYLPLSVNVGVAKGDKVKAGSSIIGELSNVA